jgi:hypothetical protein
VRRPKTLVGAGGPGAYTQTPPDWSPIATTTVGPFTTHVTYRLPDGRTVEWASRRHRKHASLLSRAGRKGVWWAPHRASWWIGVLFAIGSACFLVAPFPGFVELVGSGADGIVFFVGSIFFTTAAALQWLEAINADEGPDPATRRRLRVVSFEPHRIDWWSSGVQLVGTVLFNVNTFHALQEGLDAESYDRLVGTPGLLGSICFLVAGTLAYVEVGRGRALPKRRTLEWWIAAVNLLGCIAFGIAAVAAFWVPSQGSIAHLAAANAFTAFGGLCFLVGAVLLLPEGAAEPERAA